MESIDIIKLIIEGGTVAIFALVVLAFTRLLGPVLTMMQAANEQQAKAAEKAQHLLENDLAEEKRERLLLSARLDTQVAEQDRLKAKARDMESQIEKLKKLIEDKDAEICVLKEKIRALEASDLIKNGRIKELERELEAVRKERDVLKVRLDVLEKLADDNKVIKEESCE